jgi:hypothetical protein
VLLSPPNRLRSREKNREYEKETESKREARHVMDAELEVESGSNANLVAISVLSTVSLDTARARLNFAAMPRVRTLLLSSALGLIGRGLLCVGEGGRSE